MGPLANASAGSLHAFVADHVEPGARVITDGWGGYLGLEQLGYLHDRRSQRAARARGRIPTSYSRRSTGSRRWSSAGSWAPTRARSATHTYPDT